MREATVLSTPNLSLLTRLQEARANTDALFRRMMPEALYDRPIPERHRIVFYIGHLEAFDWNLLARGAFEMEPFHPGYDKLFAFGIDPVDGKLPSDQPSDWPPMAEVLGYCQRVRARLNGRLREFFESGERVSERTAPVADGTLLHVAVEHRLMHAETLAYMLHQLPLGRKLPDASPPAPLGRPPEARIVEIPAGVATLGAPTRRGREGEPVFGWDNEFDEYTVQVPAFRIDAQMVTNSQFLEFLRAGGYEDRSLWTPQDWEWVQAVGIRHPAFWVPRQERFLYRAMFEEIPLPLDWPVYASHAEASAYARWAGKALPSEAQWHRAAYGTPKVTEREFPWGAVAPQPQHGNFDFRRWDPAPAGAFPAGRSAFGLDDLLGNGWEWMSTVFAPFAGFEKFPFYPGYSADFFDGKHYVMKGGSPRTAACMLRRSFRNWFQAHYQSVYAGFRCVEGQAG
jgi:ergothioneine biosynthesis protein EgtB